MVIHTPNMFFISLIAQNRGQGYDLFRGSCFKCDAAGLFILIVYVPCPFGHHNITV